MDPYVQFCFTLLVLCVWREARGEGPDAMLGVAWSIRNRVLRPGWWGHSWMSVILMPLQYSSFNHNDPNATKWPSEESPTFTDCLIAANKVYTFDLQQAPLVPDPTGGATHYFDASLDHNPPTWAKEMTKTCEIGRLRFYK